MRPLPHHFSVTAYAGVEGSVLTESAQAPALAVYPPLQAGGPGKTWSPEDLLLAAIADGFTLSFRALARNSRLGWQDLQVTVEAELDWQQQQLKFTQFNARATISLAEGQDRGEATSLLLQAKHNCMVVNCLSLDLDLEVVFSSLADIPAGLCLPLQ